MARRAELDEDEREELNRLRELALRLNINDGDNDEAKGDDQRMMDIYCCQHQRKEKTLLSTRIFYHFLGLRNE